MTIDQLNKQLDADYFKLIKTVIGYEIKDYNSSKFLILSIKPGKLESYINTTDAWISANDIEDYFKDVKRYASGLNKLTLFFQSQKNKKI